MLTKENKKTSKKIKNVNYGKNNHFENKLCIQPRKEICEMRLFAFEMQNHTFT